MQIDHIILGAPSLQEACDWFTARSGIKPVYGGQHGHGLSHNALVALGSRCYLEIFAPMPGITGGDEWVAACVAMTAPRLLSYCFDAGPRIDALPHAFAEAGITGSEVEPWSRQRPDGTVLTWRLFEPVQDGFGAAMPFFIDWQDSEHPATTSPDGAALLDFTVRSTDAKRLSALLTALGTAGVTTVQADANGLSCRLSTPKGVVQFN